MTLQNETAAPMALGDGGSVDEKAVAAPHYSDHTFNATDFAPTFGAYDKTAALAHFAGAEILVFNGTRDVLTPPEHSRSIVDALPGAQHILIRDGGHVIMLEHPDLLNEQIITMLERADLAQERHIDMEDKPRVTQVLSNIAKKRQLRAGRHGKARRRAHG